MLTPYQAKEIIDLIKNADIEIAFFKLKEYNINTVEINLFRKEYIHGNVRFDFYERFPTYINAIAHTQHTVIPPTFDIFFSFSSKNQAAAQREVNKLRNAGLKVFFSGEDLSQHIGQEFFDKIQYALSYTKHFILYCTPQAMESKWVNIECSTFFQQIHIKDEKRRLFIVRGKNFKDDLVPLLMRGIQSSTTEEVINILKRNKVKPSVKSKSTVSKNIFTFLTNKGEKNILRVGFIFLVLIVCVVGFVEIQRYSQQKSKSYETDNSEGVDTTAIIDESQPNKLVEEKEQNTDLPDTKILSNGIKLIKVEGGDFMMGSDEYSDTKPVHKVTLTDYYIGETEVTNAQYAVFLNERKPSKTELDEWINLNGSYEAEKCRISQQGNNYVVERGYENHPVSYVSWFGANEFCTYYGGFLPSEAQWEYAAKGGNKSQNNYKYAGSNDLYEVAAIRNSSIPYEVKTKKINELGLYDMSGNVWEWCQDWYDSEYYSKSKDITNPINKIKKDNRVLRGGSLGYNSEFYRTVSRFSNTPANRDNDLGFRMAFPAE